MRSNVAESLRRHTRPSHTRVETKLNLLDPGLDTETLRSAVACLHSFWLGAEAGVASWAREHSALAARLDWSRRRRADLLAADLRLLGGIPAASAVVWTSRPTTADVLGWLYVAEGSTLGGAVIARHLQAIPAVRDRPLRSFTPYTEGPGPMWRAYLVELAEWTGVDEGRIERGRTGGRADLRRPGRVVRPVRGRGCRMSDSRRSCCRSERRSISTTAPASRSTSRAASSRAASSSQFASPISRSPRSRRTWSITSESRPTTPSAASCSAVIGKSAAATVARAAAVFGDLRERNPLDARVESTGRRSCSTRSCIVRAAACS